jgi:predicted transcriptional regulator
VLAVLTTAQQPMTPAQVRDAIGAGLAYTTVMTVLGRLHGKGMVTREQSGRAYAYTAVRDEATITARQMRQLLDAGTDRAAVLSRFVGALSDEDEQVLAGLLRRAEEDQPS